MVDTERNKPITRRFFKEVKQQNCRRKRCFISSEVSGPGVNSSTGVTSMLVTKCVGDNFKMLVTVLAILVTNIHLFCSLTSGTNIQLLSPTTRDQHHDVTNIVATVKSDMPSYAEHFLLVPVKSGASEGKF